MGEAKRRQRQDVRLAGSLSERLRAGEFGPPEQPETYLVLLDRSPSGRQMLTALGAEPGLVAALNLQPLFEGEVFRIWEASALFEFVLLAGGTGRVEERSRVAANMRRLLDDVLPRVLKRLGPSDRPTGLVWGMTEARRLEIEAAAKSRPELTALAPRVAASS